MLTNTPTAYGSVSKFFHWLIFILLVGMLTYGYFLEDFPKDVQPVTYNIHKLIGLSILALMCLRLLWRISNPKPELTIGMPAWQRKVERWVHYSMYVFILLMPIAGWVGSAAAGHDPHLGSVTFSLPIAQNKTVAEVAFWFHNNIALVIIALISIHFLAALYHQLFKRDNLINKIF